jgi:hypothetical protein
MNSKERKRGLAYIRKGYGRQRYRLFRRARKHIIFCIKRGFYLEAITLIESLIADRLESRISYVIDEDYSFKTLGNLVIKARECEKDAEILTIVDKIDQWRAQRNGALHEMVKIEEGTKLTWKERTERNRQVAIEGYRVLVEIYQRVADLNPLHTDRVFTPYDLTKLG